MLDCIVRPFLLVDAVSKPNTWTYYVLAQHVLTFLELLDLDKCQLNYVVELGLNSNLGYNL